MPCLFLSLALAAAATSTPSVKVEIRAAVYPAGAVPSGQILLRRVDTSFGETRRFPLASSMPLELPKGSSWEVTADAVGFWAQPKVLYVGEPPMLTLSLWLLAPVKFPYALPSRETAPLSSAWAHFSGTSAQGEDVSGQVPCTLEAGAIVCSLPVTPVDVLLRVSGFASEPFWDLHPVPNRTIMAPARVLRPGASVIGFVTDERGAPARAQVELKPWSSSESFSPAKPGTAGMVSTGLKGFFQFSGVAPGLYRVEARGKGVQASLGPVTVEGDRETELSRPLRLAAPASLEVNVVPATMPHGQAWKLLMLPLNGGNSSVRERTVPPNGSLKIGEVAPGGYTLLLTSSQNDREVWAQRTVSVPDEPLVFFDLPVVRVAGRVREGGDPLPSLVAFGGTVGSIKVVLEANSDGDFEGFLPRPGSWRVAVAAKGKKPMVWNTVVEVPPPRGNKPSWVDLSVSAGEVSGWVRDTEGTPQAGAIVEVYTPDHPGIPYPGTRADEDGRFHLVAPPGRVLLQARHHRRASPPVEVTVKAGEPLKAVELVLAEQRVVEGQVLGVPGTTHGIQVDAHVLWPAPSPPRGRTDTQSRFRFFLDPGISSVTVVAFPRSGSLAVGCTEVPAPGSLQVPVSPVAGGTLEVLDGAKVTAWVDVVARYQGCPLFLVALHEWARYVGANPLSGAHWVFPRLPPGVWELCSYRWAGLGGVLGPCEGGVLPPGGTLQLKLPHGPQEPQPRGP